MKAIFPLILLAITFGLCQASQHVFSIQGTDLYLNNQEFEQPVELQLNIGDHLLYIWSLDDGFRFDKIVLGMREESPTGTGSGPPGRFTQRKRCTGADPGGFAPYAGRRP
jgi:hypothetical protein